MIRDPYILDFPGSTAYLKEGDLEAAIIGEIESFLLVLRRPAEAHPDR
ncbi:DUF1016 domain-containing protein [Xylella taiwanensis]|nr:DUF1016 domain-containing protein [Xylella taiwanensis]MCD8455958.1 DUF1016 domain-containing protein [Xylella taiwanensis]MCD8463441.1 DUF1016 domain-containing protein [Xylella taiwanensis]